MTGTTPAAPSSVKRPNQLPFFEDCTAADDNTPPTFSDVCGAAANTADTGRAPSAFNARAA